MGGIKIKVDIIVVKNISRVHNSNYSKPIIKINNHTLKYIKTTQLSNNIHLPFLLLSKQRRKR